MTDQERSLPEQYIPLSPWAYFGYTILFSIPILGIICLIFCSFSNSNINRRNFARSYFCVLVLAIILIIVSIVANISLDNLFSFMPNYR